MIIFLLILSFTCRSQLIINEFNPHPEGEEEEWIELYNNSSEIIEHKSIYIADAINDDKIEDFTIKPDQYVVITGEPKILNEIYNVIQCGFRCPLNIGQSWYTENS